MKKQDQTALFPIPGNKKIRVIIDTDAACEADDPFAIVQALLSPKLIVRGIAAEHFAQEGSMELSYAEIRTILDAMEMDVRALRGQKGPLSEDSEASEAVSFLIEEAMAEDERPLFVLCQGAITNVAMALKKEPGIRDRMTVIWIGTHGTAYGTPPFREFNAGNDVEAANLVLSSGCSLWLVPSYVYTTVHIGIAEIARRIRPCGRIGEHLYAQLMEYNHTPGAWWTQGESWSLGDSPAIAIAINPGCGRFETACAPHVEEDTASTPCPENPQIRIYRDVDSRYILEDLIAKLELFTET
ncbi:MAG: nucleoside hydrolase [Lachnospiraceae bacterium]|nr:nucleoside hydrolase [Lachnospiraceae bacterium]